MCRCQRPPGCSLWSKLAGTRIGSEDARMVLRPPDRKPPEPAGTYKRLRGDLERAEAELRKILRLAPRATEKYPEIGQAARAVLHALTRAVQDHADADSAWRRYEREKMGR